MERGSRLKLLIHDPYPARKNSPNGVSNYIREIVPYLEEGGCDVRIAAPSIRDRENDFADYHLGMPKEFSINKTHFDASVSFNKRRAYYLIKTVKPDLIISHEPGVPNSAHTLMSGIPEGKNGKMVAMVGHFHAQAENIDIKTQLASGVLQLFRRPRFKYGVPVALTPGPINTLKNSLAGRIAVSQATAAFWNNFFPGEYRVIPNGINTSELTPDGPKIEEWQDGKKTILFAGRHDERKGIGYLLRAYNKLRKSGVNNIKLKLTGYGDYTEKLKQIVEDEQIPDVEFMGVVSREDLVKAYRSADLFVAPSIGGEGFNRTIAEARSCGTLVVCTRIKGHTEAIGEDLLPFMANPSDAEDLAEKIKLVLGFPQNFADTVRQKTSEDVRRRFSWESIASANVAYYDEVLIAHGKPQPSDWRRKEKTIFSRIPILGTVFVNVKQKS